MKNLKWIALIIILMAAVVTNPTHQKHQDEINKDFKADHPLIGKVGGGKLLSALTTYENYYVGSATTIDGQVASYGFLGVVVVQDLEGL